MVVNFPNIIILDTTTTTTVRKYWTSVLLILISLILAVFIFVAIGRRAGGNFHLRKVPLKCKICGRGHNYTHWMGDFYGNHCTNGSFGEENEDCGIDSACFKMNVLHSKYSKRSMEWMNRYLKRRNHTLANTFQLLEGTVRGCIKGYGWKDSCHFPNTSYFWTGDHNQERLYWSTSNLCVCTTDNCN